MGGVHRGLLGYLVLPYFVQDSNGELGKVQFNGKDTALNTDTPVLLQLCYLTHTVRCRRVAQTASSPYGCRLSKRTRFN